MAKKTDAEIIAEIIEAWDRPTDWETFGQEAHYAIAERLARKPVQDHTNGSGA